MRWTSSSVRSLVRRVGSICASAQTLFALVLPIPYRYVSEIWICFSRGRSTPEMRAIRYPCLCLCRGLAAQITRTTPLRRITLHFTQIFLTEARTFMGVLRNGALRWARARIAARDGPEDFAWGAAPLIAAQACADEADPAPPGKSGGF